jgi:hypothetical protein
MNLWSSNQEEKRLWQHLILSSTGRVGLEKVFFVINGQVMGHGKGAGDFLLAGMTCHGTQPPEFTWQTRELI